jgi:hypothetical protein
MLGRKPSVEARWRSCAAWDQRRHLHLLAWATSCLPDVRDRNPSVVESSWLNLAPHVYLLSMPFLIALSHPRKRQRGAICLSVWAGRGDLRDMSRSGGALVKGIGGWSQGRPAPRWVLQECSRQRRWLWGLLKLVTKQRWLLILRLVSIDISA